MAAATTRPNFTTLSYETHRFVQSYEKVHIVCGVLSALGILNACTSGFTKTGVGASCRAFHHLMVLFVRRWLQRMEDKDSGVKTFLSGAAGSSSKRLMAAVRAAESQPSPEAEPLAYTDPEAAQKPLLGK